MSLEALYRELHGVPMSAEAQTRILKVEKFLGIRDNDALWQVILLFDYYQRLFQEFPDRIKEQTLEAVGEVRKVTDETVRAASLAIRKAEEEARFKIIDNMERTVHGLVEQAIRKAEAETYAAAVRYNTWQWFVVGLSVGVIGMLGAWWIGYDTGWPVK